MDGKQGCCWQADVSSVNWAEHGDTLSQGAGTPGDWPLLLRDLGQVPVSHCASSSGPGTMRGKGE